jgi:hypothetical protein
MGFFSFKDGSNNVLDFNLYWLVSLVLLLCLLGISGTWLPFLFLLCFSIGICLIWVSNDTNSAATISGLAYLFLLCLLVFNLGFFSSCTTVCIGLSSRCSGDDWPTGLAYFSLFMI